MGYHVPEYVVVLRKKTGNDTDNAVTSLTAYTTKPLVFPLNVTQDLIF